MVKKSVWALFIVALLAVAFTLPASAQDMAISARATEMHTVGAPNPTPPPAPPIFINFGTFVAANCPNVNSQYLGCSWTPNGLLICGTSATACSGSAQNIAEPFTPVLAATMHHVEIPVQSDGGTTATFTASVQTDNMGLPLGTYGAPPTVKHVVAAIAPFWTCCGVGAGAGQGGTVVPLTLALAPATQYWIVVDTNNAADIATQDVWAASGQAPYIGFCVGTAPCTTYGAFIANNTPAMKVY